MGDVPDVIVSKSGKRPQPVAPAEPDPMKGGDVYGWAMGQAALIRDGRYDEIDWINIADEIESVGRSEVNVLRSGLTVLIQHLLKWDHQPSRRSRSWQLSIREHRRRVERTLRENPSLKPKLDAICKEAFSDGRDRALTETNLPDDEIPSVCPYDWDAIMTRPMILYPMGETP